MTLLEWYDRRCDQVSIFRHTDLWFRCYHATLFFGFGTVWVPDLGLVSAGDPEHGLYLRVVKK